MTLHNASILSINAGEHWLGIGAADNSMSLFHRPQERLGGLSATGSKMAGWQLYRTPQKAVATVVLFLFTNFIRFLLKLLSSLFIVYIFWSDSTYSFLGPDACFSFLILLDVVICLPKLKFLSHIHGFNQLFSYCVINPKAIL